MKSFTLKRESKLERDILFKISTDVANFDKIMPTYFKSLKVTKKNNSEQFVLEKISFLGFTITVKTKHVFLHPNIHKVFILSGPLKNSSFIENYEISANGTNISILINLETRGILKIIPFCHNLLAARMSRVMNEFILSAESYSAKLSI